jgi:tripartite-type tricarboxylate transporter receptor subunit TctC
MISRRSLLHCLPAVAALRAGLACSQQGYPTKLIRVIVPTGPGTATDLTARYFAAALQKAWGQSLITENRPGAGGVIGTDVVAKASPDGYTLLFTYGAHYTNQFVIDNTPFDAIRDFEPIARVASSALFLVTAPDSPLRSVQDLVDQAKRNPNTISYGSAGNGTTGHMCAALFCSLAEIQMNHIPYKNPAQASLDASTGQLDVAFNGASVSLALIKAGRLRALAVTATTRSAQLPDVPTMAESGLKGYDISSPVWAFAPRGTPAPIVARLSEAIVRAASAPEFKGLCSAQGIEVDIQDAATVKAGAPAELAKWKHLVAITKS